MGVATVVSNEQPMMRDAAPTHTLPLVTLYLSERCNSRCVTCDYWRHGTMDATLDSVRRLLPDLAALRTRVVLVSGGEPLLNPEWAEIAALLKSRGLALWLLTSGLSLAKHARRVVALFDSVTVSLDGTTPETYLAIRGVDAFENVCAGVRAIATAGAAVSLRVTLQRTNYRELPRFVTLARELGVTQISFLAVDVSNPHAFARREGFGPELMLRDEDIPILDALLERLEREHVRDFRTGLIAESPAKLHRIRDYFAALRGRGAFPPVRCNAPEFSAVISADGRVAPCFFIPGPAEAPRAPELRAALASTPMRSLRAAIRAGERSECVKCVCSMWREPATLRDERFLLEGGGRA
jgi:MoaA/NifB/PqqE/SkfB family radical SAM enzyme